MLLTDSTVERCACEFRAAQPVASFPGSPPQEPGNEATQLVSLLSHNSHDLSLKRCSRKRQRSAKDKSLFGASPAALLCMVPG